MKLALKPAGSVKPKLYLTRGGRLIADRILITRSELEKSKDSLREAFGQLELSVGILNKPKIAEKKLAKRMDRISELVSKAATDVGEAERRMAEIVFEQGLRER